MTSAVGVSGTIGTVSSGQQVTVNGSLVDAHGGAVAGSHIALTFKCP